MTAKATRVSRKMFPSLVDFYWERTHPVHDIADLPEKATSTQVQIS